MLQTFNLGGYFPTTQKENRKESNHHEVWNSKEEKKGKRKEMFQIEQSHFKRLGNRM